MQNIDIKQTEQATEGAPVQSFLGGVTGGTLALPFGGGGAGVVTKLITGTEAGAWRHYHRLELARTQLGLQQRPVSEDCLTCCRAPAA